MREWIMRAAILVFALALAAGCSAGRINITAQVSINPAPSVCANGQVGVAYSCQLQAVGGTAPYTWSVLASGSTLPAGLSLATGTGLISGTPTAIGSSAPVIQVKDSSLTPETATITVDPEIRPRSRRKINVTSGPLSISNVFPGTNIENSGAPRIGMVFGMAGQNLTLPDSLTFVPGPGCATCSGPTPVESFSLVQSSGFPNAPIITGVVPQGLLPGEYAIQVVYNNGTSTYTTPVIDPRRK